MRSFRFLALGFFVAVGTSLEAKPLPPLPPPSPIYLNLEPIEPPDIPPQIDALAFENRSLFVVQDAQFLLSNPTFFFVTASGSSLYQGQSVLSWKNSGTMLGVPGFRFETLPDVRRLTAKQRRKPGASLPRPAQSFMNEGEITVGTQLYVQATNIANPGRLEGDLGSRISLLAPNGTADLSRGAIRIGRLASSFAPAPLFFFTLDPELVTLYAATGTNGIYNRSNLPPITLPSAFSPYDPPIIPSYQVLVNPTLQGRSVTFRITNSLSFVETCGTGYKAFTEVTDSGLLGLGKTVTVAFVDTNSLIETNFSVDVRFLNSFSLFGPTIAVEYQSREFDIIEQRPLTNFITFLDTGSILQMPPPTNAFSVFPTPSNYQLVRARVAGFETGSPGNTNFTPSLFYDQNFRTSAVPYLYSAVSLQLGPPNLGVANPFTSIFLDGLTLGTTTVLADPTNFPSRVEITAKNLNLDHARIRAEQAIDIHASNLVGNTFAQVDAPFLNFDVASTNENLVISNLAPAVVNRPSGQISAYSATWTANVTNQLTGVVEPVRFHVLVMGNCLQFSQPVVLHRLLVQATNLVLEDSLFVNNGLKLNAESLTIGSNANLQLPFRSNWAFTNVLNLSHFTNFGIVDVSGVGAYFGTPPSGYVAQPPKKRKKPKKGPTQPVLEPYVDFVNHNIVQAASISLSTEFLENTGTALNPAYLVATNGPLVINASSATISNALLFAGENVEFHGNDLLLNGTTIIAGGTSFSGARTLPGALVLDITNSLADGGVTANNVWQVTAGVRMTTRPLDPGDFMGTRIESFAGTFAQAFHTWAGEDRGLSVEGFTNNLALGRLVLDGSLANRFRFQSVAGTNALYVDFLELRNDATNYSGIGIDPNFTIYFANSAPISPETLNDFGGGRLRWVSDYAGPQSSTNLVYPNGITYSFNIAAVQSFNRDDDGDGIPNDSDCTPIIPPGEEANTNLWFGANCSVAPLSASPKSLPTAVVVAISLAPEGRDVVLNWNAPANSANTIEFAESLGGAWQPLTNFINGPVDARVTLRDAATASLRVYRVRVDAGKP